MTPFRSGRASLPMNRLVATPVKAWVRFAKRASPAGSPVFAALRRGRRRQLQSLVLGQASFNTSRSGHNSNPKNSLRASS